MTAGLTWRLSMLAYSLSVLGPARAAAAPTEYEHTPRHGGMFGDADDRYHYEVLRDAQNRLVVYVGDAQNRPLDARRLEGRYRLNPDDPAGVSAPLTASADGATLRSPTLLIPAGEPVAVLIEVRQGRDWVGVEFHLPPTGGMAGFEG